MFLWLLIFLYYRHFRVFEAANERYFERKCFKKRLFCNFPSLVHHRNNSNVPMKKKWISSQVFFQNFFYSSNNSHFQNIFLWLHFSFKFSHSNLGYFILYLIVVELFPKKFFKQIIKTCIEIPCMQFCWFPLAFFLKYLFTMLINLLIISCNSHNNS